MATVRQCDAALRRLAADLATVDPEVRGRYVPDRSLLCRVRDLEVVFTARIDPEGLHDIRLSADEDPGADVKLTVDSDELVALAARPEDFVGAWLRGKVQISASMRDMLRLRTLFGL